MTPQGIIEVRGGAPEDATIPVVRDPSAPGGSQLRLDTESPAPGRGWYAAYRLNAPAPGPYALSAVLLPPAMADSDFLGGSWFTVAVNGSGCDRLPESDPFWAELGAEPQARGSLVRADLGDVELREGENVVSFEVGEPMTWGAFGRYRFALDSFTLRPTRMRLAGVRLADDASSPGGYRGRDAELIFQLNCHPTEPADVDYRVLDYHSHEVAGGTARVEAGCDRASVALPQLVVGHYRIVANLDSEPAEPALGSFARLPPAPDGRAAVDRFGVTVSSGWLLSTPRLEKFARLAGSIGLDYVRDEIDWQQVEPARGQLAGEGLKRSAEAFREAGVSTLGAIWTLTGNVRAPDWALGPESDCLPADLRDAYGFMQSLAMTLAPISVPAIEVWNEPDVDVLQERASMMPADQLAAYVKAAGLGILEASPATLAVLPGIAFPGAFQDLMLQNDVCDYADVWAFHGYAFDEGGDALRRSRAATINSQLMRDYDFAGPLWMTESGVFLDTDGSAELTDAQQRQQARYLVQSTVQAWAAGVDKPFWFSGPPYGIFGLLNQAFEPLYSLSALASALSIVGDIPFAERFEELPAGAEGYLFARDQHLVAVVWASSRIEADLPFPATEVEAYDLVGAPAQAPEASGGTWRVTLSKDPLYLVSRVGTASPPEPARDGSSRSKELTPAQRVVLRQRFDPQHGLGTPKPGYEQDENPAYELPRDASMRLEIYNFDSAPQEVTVRSHAWGGWEVSPASRVVTVAAEERETVDFRLSAGAEVNRETAYPLMFTGAAGGQEVSRSVSRIRCGEAADGPVRSIAPVVANISPADRALLPEHDVQLRADVSDALTGQDPRRVRVTVDGDPVDSRFADGVVSASLNLSSGEHLVRIRAVNEANVPGEASVRVRIE